MEIFIDLAKISEGQTETSLPGIDLNLSGLLNFNKPEISPTISQNLLKTEEEIQMPAFNPIEYFDQIQAEFDKIKAAQESFSIKDDVKTFQEAQQNSTIALDPFAAYLEERFTKIESITSDKSEIRQLIQGVSDNTLSSIQTVINSPLTQTESIEKINSMESISNSIEALIEKTQSFIPSESPMQSAVGSTISNLLTNVEETNFNQTSQNIGNLTETISNFATNMLGGGASNITNLQALPDATKSALTITKEVPKPDFGAESLSTLRQIAETGSAMFNNSTVNNNSSSTITNNTTEAGSMGPGITLEAPPSNSNPSVIMSGGGIDNSAIYLMQMLNILKSGQLKVKLS